MNNHLPRAGAPDDSRAPARFHRDISGWFEDHPGAAWLAWLAIAIGCIWDGSR